TLGGKDTGGMNVYVRDLTRQLGRDGVHVDVFTRSQDEHIPHVLHDLGYGNRVVHIPAGPETPLPKQELAGYIPTFAAEIEKFAAEKGIHYDLIHSHYWMSGIAAETLKKAWGTPVVHMFHTLGKMKNRVAQTQAEREGEYRVNGERRVMRVADCIVAATLAEQAQLQFLYHADDRKVTIIPPGVDLSRFYPIPADEAKAVIGIPPNDRMLLFVGRIEPLKGVDHLLRAMAQMNDEGVLSRFPHYLAVIGGEPDADPEDMSAEMRRLQSLSAELGLGDLVIFLGKQSQDTLPYYYSAAEMVVVPSHYESFGMVALEAMACGTPVVASQVGGLAFLIQDGVTGFHVPDGDTDALCTSLTRLIKDPDLREQMGKNAAAAAVDYGWDRIAARIEALYHDVLTVANRPDGRAEQGSLL
ncbi:MAG TPA: glycosyltransferase, partial [Anaerolineaceae bacterium]|nr:glycosyltransferase [Anaerolineaceae bacterium]